MQDIQTDKNPMKRKNNILIIDCQQYTNDSKSDNQNQTSTTSASSSPKIPQKKKTNQLFQKIRKTLNSTTKADKYVRLCSSFVKLIRASDPIKKKQLSQLYAHILKLRQIIRWNGLYETIVDFNDMKDQNITSGLVFDFLFKCFQLYGDMLDRIMFALDMIDNHPYKQFYQKIDKIQTNCYFIECCIWVVYHLTTLKNTKTKKQKYVKIAKLIKYIIDSLTSYCKFSLRKFQLQPKTIAILNILSSLIGIFTILY